MTFAPAIETVTTSIQPVFSEVARLAGVTKNFGANRALDQIDLSVNQGEIVALLGPNGPGKSTAVKLMLGLLRPDAGSVRIFGNDPRDARNRRHTGAMLQVARVPETLRVREHIDLFSSYYPQPLPVSETMEAAGLKGIEDRMSGALSGGQKQRVLFALALCGDPDLLFLDEPTVGMDVEARRGMWAQIRALAGRGKSILLTTHYLEEADELANRIVVIHRGHAIANGRPAEIKRLTAGQVVRCRTQLPVAAVRAFRFADEVREERAVVEIRTSNSDEILRQLILADREVCDIELKSAGLEEAFLALTANYWGADK
jgi:ABC-2 type transport system ATP-binding protein